VSEQSSCEVVTDGDVPGGSDNGWHRHENAARQFLLLRDACTSISRDSTSILTSATSAASTSSESSTRRKGRLVAFFSEVPDFHDDDTGGDHCQAGKFGQIQWPPFHGEQAELIHNSGR
jgi:hypothetical protein